MKVAPDITRDRLGKVFNDVRLVRAFERQAQVVDENSDGLATTAVATEAMNEATVIVLSPNAAFNNERVLVLGEGLSGNDNGSELVVSISDSIPVISGGFKLFLAVAGDSSVALPLTGTLATIQNPETLQRKTLDKPRVTVWGDFADDAAAATGGCPVGGVYRTGSNLKVRVS